MLQYKIINSNTEFARLQYEHQNQIVQISPVISSASIEEATDERQANLESGTSVFVVYKTNIEF
jgi:hypothetical protein